VVVTFGAGVFHYVTYNSIFSHAFSFFAASTMLLCAVRWYECPSLCSALLFGYFAAHHLFARPYPGESFYFAHPHLIGSLLSFPTARIAA
jgi:hypothetical protein